MLRTQKTGDSLVDRLLARPFKPRVNVDMSQEARQKRIAEAAVKSEVLNKSTISAPATNSSDG